MIDIYGFKIKERIDKKFFDYFLSFVSLKKRAKIKKIIFYCDAQRSLMGEIIAKFAICKRINIDNDSLKISHNKYGKPILLKPKGVYYNISHSGDWVVCAVDNNPIGIDVELIRKIDINNIARRFFSKNEYIDLLNRENDSLRYFYILWTLKESYIKAIGKGLTIPLDSFSFIIKNDYVKMIENNNEINYFKYYEIDQKHIVSICASNIVNRKNVEIVNLDQLLTFVEQVNKKV